MGKWVRALPLLLALVVMPVLAQTSDDSEPSAPILIVEIQTGSIASANDEFVELYNQTNESIPVDDFKLQYRSATGLDWLTKASLEGVIEPRGRYLIASGGLNVEANVTNGLGLALGGGHLRLIESAAEGEVVLDQVAWGSAQFALANPAPPPPAGHSLKRNLNEDGRFVDTEDDNQDFSLSTSPTPESTPIPKVEESESETNGSGTSSNSDEGTTPRSTANTSGGSHKYAKIEISELLPDPDKPLNDAEDEFVELHNPNSEAIDLEGYIIETGSKYSYDFTIPNITIKAKQYLAFYSLDTGLALSNSGGAARLLAPDKAPMYEAPAYEKSKPDVAWANIAGVWQWTARPTPNAPNQAAATASASRSGSDASSGRTYLSQGRSLAATDDNRSIYEEPPSSENQVNTAVVAGVGAMALLYAGNEYRYDIGNFFQKFKKYLASRRGRGVSA